LCRRLWFDTDGDIQQRGHAFFMSEASSLQSDVVRESDARYFETDYLLKDLHQRTFRGGVVTLTGQGAKFFLQMVSGIVLARLLLPRDFGLIAMVTSVTGFIAMFRDLGLSNATIQRAEITHAQVSFLFWINCVLGILATLIVAISAPFVARFYHEPRLTSLTVALSINFIFSGLAAQHQALLRRQMQFKTTAIIDVVAIASGTVIAIIMAICGFRYWSLVGAQFGTSGVSCALVWARCKWRPGVLKRRVGARPMLAFGGHLTGFTVLNYFTRNFDNILVGRVLGPAPLGIYVKAYGLLMLPISQINMPIGAVLLPGLSRLQNNPTEYSKLFLRAIVAMSFITVPIVVFSFFFAHDVVLVLLGQQWLPAAHVFQLLSPAAVVGAIGFAPNWLSQSLGRTKQQLHFALVSAPVCVAGFLIGIKWGLAGVAVSFSVSFVVLVWAYVWYASRNSPIKSSDVAVSFLSAFAPACVAGLAAWSLQQTLLSGTKPLFTISICAPLFGILYLGMSLLLKRSRSVIFAAMSALRKNAPWSRRANSVSDR